MKVVPALLALVCLTTLSAKDKSPAPDKPADEVVVLEPFKIKAKLISSFAFDLRIYADPDTKKVDRMFVTRVLEDTDAAKFGLRDGDEIIKIDGMAVKDMDARVAPDTPLGAIFLNRQPGEPLNLEVVVRRSYKLTVHAQQVLPGAVPP
jgi:predicted metalloprotease with PDZ domain